MDEQANAGADPKKIRVRTTLPAQPMPASGTRPRVRTRAGRLVLRPLAPGDLPAYHALRSQPEVMAYSSQGRPDRDAAESRGHLGAFLPPHGDTATYNCAVCLAASPGGEEEEEDGDMEKDGEEGEGPLVGVGGMHRTDQFSGWPEVGYMFRREHWGRGYASEFLAAWLETWWGLPRSGAGVEVEVDPRSLLGLGLDLDSAPGEGDGDGDGDGDADGAAAGVPPRVPEHLTAFVEEGNVASRRVLEKCGFRPFVEWTELDDREGGTGAEAKLVGYSLARPN